MIMIGLFDLGPTKYVYSSYQKSFAENPLALHCHSLIL
jgi:hypothetical protein